MVAGLFADYNVDNDGLLKFQELVRFFTDLSRDEPDDVEGNLRSCFVQENYRFMYESDDEEE